MAKFLQETVRESALKVEGVVKSDEFKEFFRKVGSMLDTADPRSGQPVKRLTRPMSFELPSCSTTILL